MVGCGDTTVMESAPYYLIRYSTVTGTHFYGSHVSRTERISLAQIYPLTSLIRHKSPQAPEARGKIKLQNIQCLQQSQAFKCQHT